jgi:hypothetical protein
MLNESKICCLKPGTGMLKLEPPGWKNAYILIRLTVQRVNQRYKLFLVLFDSIVAKVDPLLV